VAISHQKDVHPPVFGAELGVGPFLDGGDELVGEVVPPKVQDLEIGKGFLNMIHHGVEEMGLSQPRAAIDKEGVVGLGRRVGHV
jgi:hypothetical protein